MRKIVLYIAMSLDGYIADTHGGVGWLGGDGSDADNPGSYPSFIESVDTVILGFRTYNQIVTELSPDTWVYSEKKSFVLTHKKLNNTENVTFTDESIPSLLQRLKQENGKDIWICGGADIVNQALGLDIIDKFCITIIPTILGNGIRLFDVQKTQIPLKLISTKSYNGITDLVYECRLKESGSVHLRKIPPHRQS